MQKLLIEVTLSETQKYFIIDKSNITSQNKVNKTEKYCVSATVWQKRARKVKDKKKYAEWLC